MPRVTRIRIRRQSGETVDARIANVTIRTLFAETGADFAFRERVRFTLLDFEFDGEIAFVLSGPLRGAIIAFSAPPVLQASLAENLGEFEVIAPELAEVAQTLDSINAIADEWVEKTNPNSPIDDEAPDVDVSIAEEIPEVLATDTDVGLGSVAPTLPPVDFSVSPNLQPDGVTVIFDSIEHFRFQYKANLVHGGLVVAAKPVAVGVQRFLALVIPGRERYTVSARATYNGSGTVGFAIDTFAMHKARLAQLAAE